MHRRLEAPDRWEVHSAEEVLLTLGDLKLRVIQQVCMGTRWVLRLNTTWPVVAMFASFLPLQAQPSGLTAKKVGVGACLWDGALVLAAYLRTLPRHRFHGMRCVELGAGVGTVGLVAARLGAHATITDIRKVLPLLQDNLAANGFDPYKTR